MLSTNQKFFLSLLFAAALMTAVVLLDPNTCKKTVRDISKEAFAGTVDSTYRGGTGNKMAMVVFTTGKEASLNFRDPDLFDSLKKGDSLIKKKDSIAIDVFRNGTLLKRYYCICWVNEYRDISQLNE